MGVRKPGDGANGGQHQISRAMGALEERVSNLVKSVEREREDAHTHRESLRNVMTALGEAVRALTLQITDIVPDIKDYRERRAELRGQVRLGKAVWFGAIGGAMGFGALVSWALQHFSFH